LDCAPSPPYEGGARGGSLVEDIECMQTNREAIYVYGFAGSGTRAATDLPGVEEAEPVRVLEVAGLAALVSEVPVEPFESPSAAELSWLVPRALRHEGVLETMRASGPIFPVRFGSLFTTRAALEDWAAENRATIASFLEHVADKDEWTIKLDLEIGSALESLAEGDPGWASRVRGLPASPGARYLLEKRLLEGARQAVREAAWEAAARIRAAARDVAEERILAPRKRESHDLEPILHAAYLVPRGAVPEFHERTGLAIGHLGCLRLESSGPWPPSHFCPPIASPAP
jgi:hypothetical protein